MHFTLLSIVKSLGNFFSNKMSEKFCLQWNDFKENIKSAFENLREVKNFSDVTLVCEDGQKVEAHKVILAASSPFFQKLLGTAKHANPLIFMRKVKYEDLLAIIDFLYLGEANIFQDNLDSFLAIADELQLKGLVGKVNENVEEDKVDQKYTPPDLFNAVAKVSNNLFCQTSSREFSEAKSDGTVEVTHDFVGNQEDLDKKVKSMMQISQNLRPNGLQRAFLCKVCGKEGHGSTIKNHIEANHLEGIVIPCNHCDKTFRSGVQQNGLI